MKKLILRALALGLLVPALGACSDDGGPAGSDVSGKGGFDPTVALNSEVRASDRFKAPARAEYSEVTPADLSLRLTSADGSFSKTWAKLADFDTDERFNVGDYTLEAFYGSEEDSEGFEKPWFQGSQTLTVRENEVTPVSLTVELANAMVSLEYSEAFKNYMSSYSAEIHAAAGTVIPYTATETRPAYVTAGLTEVYVDFVKPNGKGAKLLSASFTAAPRTHYHVTFDLSQETGDAVLKVIYDDMLTQEDVEIDLSDELLNLPAPTVSLTGFASGEAIKFVPGKAPEDDLKINIIAQGKIGRVLMETRSASLTSRGWPASANLVGAENLRATLAALGMTARGLYSNPDKMAVIDLSQLPGNITLVDGSDNVTEITFTVIDAVGKSAEPVVLRLEAAPLAVSLANPGMLFVGGSEMTVDLNYNGGNPTGAVKVQYFNDRGTWSDAAVNYAGKAEDVYTASLSGLPATADALRLRAVVGSLVSEELKVDRTPVALNLSAADADVYATKARVTVTAANTRSRAAVDIDGLLAKSKITLSTDGSSFSAATATVASGAYDISGLTPGTKYWARVEVPGLDPTEAVTFTTEAATPLSETTFDTWSSEKKGDYQYLWTTPGWATLNALTTSQSGSGSGSGLNTGGCAYKSTSGTIPANSRTTKGQDSGGAIGTSKSGDGNTVGNAAIHSDRQHSGANAALIRSVGWGKDNKASASLSGQHFGTCNNLTPGELFLGTYDGSAKYGIDFASRPSGLSFWYRYETVSAGNGDYGTAEIAVYDATGNVIARATRNLTEQAAYAQVTLPLEYTVTAKAARLSIVFKSSGNSAAMAKDTKFWRCPGVKNVSGGEYTGSELYIDDIRLNY